MTNLEKLRNDLYLCDEILIDTLRMRSQILQELTSVKQELGIAAVVPEEEERKKQKFSEKLNDYKYKDAIMDVYDSIIYQAKRIQSSELFGFNIYLIGFMGVGKSTISKALKKTFAMDVIEMDQIIAERNSMSISEIFDLRGEEYFRSEETKLLKECGESKDQIISCGGGVAMRQVNVDEMKKSGKIVLLTASPDTILGRVEDSHDRPLLEHNKTVDHITALMNAREPAYQAAADIVVDTDGKSAYQICEEIISKVKDLKNKEQAKQLANTKKLEAEKLAKTIEAEKAAAEKALN